MPAGLRAMFARDPDEPHRAASSLELLFDLVFVVAVSQASGALHHLWEEQHFAEGLLAYAMVFFAILQAWVNFTWFASAYDTDDWLYRLTTFVQMAGALVIAAGAQRAMLEFDFRAIVAGYVIMRVAMAAQWTRAAITDRRYRGTCVRYAVGVTVVQALWVTWALTGGPLWWFVVLTAADLSVAPLAERHRVTSYHHHHIAERYGLFTLIVLGESILAVANSIIGGLSDAVERTSLIVVAGGALVIVASMWWIYFDRPQNEQTMRLGRSFFWGYLHYFIFASAAAFSAGVEVAVAIHLGESHLPHTVAGLTLTVPLAIYLVATWLVLDAGRRDIVQAVGTALLAVLMVGTALLPYPLVGAAVIMVMAAALVSWRHSADKLTAL
ncbi:low temperature requirement protein A [Mycobacterium sp. CVI_P3]|uniref:Low temperature requirement protein A n=1 Tax=Mycobacterium pinniadriaticum TaxID=2994102 RepID=A0ABT3SML7_9MYCO|nr:low temperature requirement protein A [Mycobacterium pinniadriaticum]MCX2934351.1 low temperature requirement protein A [Mycobacterium pinniadriaticum]MCX2940774.1 low temperature requirement protein A [Mycobacterium pinniadriaticum]